MTVSASKYPLKKNDLYETEEWAVLALVRALKTLGLWRSGTIWEPAAGNHAMVRPLYHGGAKTVITSDKFKYRKKHSFRYDFLANGKIPIDIHDFDLVTNPPYGHNNRLAFLFAEKALARCNGFIALLLTAKFDFGNTRTHLFRDNDRFVAKVALLDRISWENNGQTGTEDHAWYIWGPRNAKPKHPIMLYERKLLS